MKRREIQSRFEEIVEFADIGPFIDTPVKRYSSGMQLRLAFSVAAHLEPEILIVDEVLSVGDLSFQQKCLGRMETASREGRTVIFISHNLPSVVNLCDRAIMLSDGRVAAAGNVGDVIDAYVGDVTSDFERGLQDRRRHGTNGKIRFVDFRLEQEGQVIDSPTTGEDFDMVLSFEKHTQDALRGSRFNLTILTLSEQTPLLDLDTAATGTTFTEIPERGELRCTVHRCPLPAGQYYVDVRADAGARATRRGQPRLRADRRRRRLPPPWRHPGGDHGLPHGARRPHLVARRRQHGRLRSPHRPGPRAGLGGTRVSGDLQARSGLISATCTLVQR